MYLCAHIYVTTIIVYPQWGCPNAGNCVIITCSVQCNILLAQITILYPNTPLAEKDRLDSSERLAEKDRLDAQTEKDRLDHEIKMRELEISRSLEIARAERDASDSKIRTTGSDNSPRSKLPYFDKDKDNMDSYLARFERYAEANSWHHGQCHYISVHC